jgi:hypothetical protein
MSPIFEQLKMVDSLRSNKTEYVIVEPGKLYFDGLPYFVRLPVLYKYIVENYVLDFSTQRFSVAHLRRPGEQTALDKWIPVLGTNVNLGHLPVYSKPPETPLVNCETDCDDMLKVSISKVEIEQAVTIPFIVDGKTLGISFVAVPGKAEYWIKLSRIWFWVAQVDAQLGKDMPIGLSAQIVHAKSHRPEYLY